MSARTRGMRTWRFGVVFLFSTGLTGDPPAASRLPRAAPGPYCSRRSRVAVPSLISRGISTGDGRRDASRVPGCCWVGAGCPAREQDVVAAITSVRRTANHPRCNAVRIVLMDNPLSSHAYNSSGVPTQMLRAGLRGSKRTTALSPTFQAAASSGSMYPLRPGCSAPIRSV